MTRVISTKHAAARVAQRAISATDLDWALWLGREVDDGLLILDKDAELAALELERQAQRIRRLGGLRVVQDGEKLITVYRAYPTKQKRLLRRADCRTLED